MSNGNMYRPTGYLKTLIQGISFAIAFLPTRLRHWFFLDCVWLFSRYFLWFSVVYFKSKLSLKS